MSKDIRSFFTVKNVTSNQNKASLKSGNDKKPQKKRQLVVIESDSDEESAPISTKRSKLSNGLGNSPSKSPKKASAKLDNFKSDKKKRALIESDSGDETFSTPKRNKPSRDIDKKCSSSKKKSPQKVSSKYFEGKNVDVKEVFASRLIKRDNSRNIVKVVAPKKDPDFDIDKDFESELLRLDETVEKELQHLKFNDKINIESKSEAKSGGTGLQKEEVCESKNKEIENECNSKTDNNNEEHSDISEKIQSLKKETSPNKLSEEKCVKELSDRRTRRTPSKTSLSSPVKETFSKRTRTPSKTSSPGKNLFDIRTRRTPQKVSQTTPVKVSPDTKTKRTPSKTPPSISNTEDWKQSRKPESKSKAQNVISPTLDKSLIKDRFRLFGKEPEKSTEVKVKTTVDDKKAQTDPQTSLLTSHSNLWVEKYKPTSTKQIIGQQGDKSCVSKLITWLKNWDRHHSGNKKLVKPSKTTTAHLVAKELDFDIVEFNASDTRSKKLLHQEVSELLSTNSLSPFFTGKGEGVSRRHVLLMDEVDGMAGNEDRGGVQELIQLVKHSRVPIICMCNDRNHPKIRSLANYCFDLRFSKPRVEQIKGAILSMCFKEKLKLSPSVVTDIISSANQDIRLIINHMSMLSVSKEDSKLANSTKHIKMGPWDITRKIFSEEEHKSMSIYDKCDLFFHDYSVTPLFVQENYLNAVPHRPEAKNKIKKMELFAKAAKSISLGDLTEKSIRSHNAWGLLPVQAVFCSLVPGDVLEGHIGAQINFPGWFGKNSRATKMSRLLQELTTHSRLKISGNKEAMNLDYVLPLESSIVSPLVREGVDGISQALAVLSEYCLVREDLESLAELTSWPNSPNRFSLVESKVKAAFTRAYNKTSAPTPYAAVPVRKGSRAEADAGDSVPDDVEGEGGSQNTDDDEENDSDADAMIVVKKKQPVKKTVKESAPATSKGSKNAKRGRKK